MNVIVFGGTGGIGKHAIRHALLKGYNVTCYVRSEHKVSELDKRVRVIVGELDDDLSVVHALQNQDAVIWCVGIPLKRKYTKMRSLIGHQVLLKAMKECGVKRLIDWATPSVPFERDQKSFITIVPGMLASIALTMAKKEMVEIGKEVQRSGLDWTMVRFMAPKDSVYTGKVVVGFGDVRMNFSIAREDIGAFMVEQVESKKFVHSMPIIGS